MGFVFYINMIEKECPVCEKIFKTKKSRENLRKYCSRRCYIKGMIPWNTGLEGFMAGVKHPNWKGGKSKDHNGYLLIASKNAQDKKRYIGEHRLIMEKYLNGKLASNELVHHINQIKDDNRIENLKVLTISEHNRVHQQLRDSKGRFVKSQKK